MSGPPVTATRIPGANATANSPSVISMTRPVAPSRAGTRGRAWAQASLALMDCPSTARLTATVRIPVRIRAATSVTATCTPVAVIALAAKVTSALARVVGRLVEAERRVGAVAQQQPGHRDGEHLGDHRDDRGQPEHQPRVRPDRRDRAVQDLADPQRPERDDARLRRGRRGRRVAGRGRSPAGSRLLPPGGGGCPPPTGCHPGGGCRRRRPGTAAAAGVPTRAGPVPAAAARGGPSPRAARRSPGHRCMPPGEAPRRSSGRVVTALWRHGSGRGATMWA